MKKCWDEDPLKRPNASEVRKIIHDWISNIIDKNINEESKNIATEFYNADKVLKNKQVDISNISDISNKSHPQAYHTSHLLDYIKKLNEILDREEISQSIGNYYLL